MSTELRDFVVTFHRGTGNVDVEDFGTDHRAALAAYEAAEDAVRNRPEIEVVLLSADSLDTIKQTHASYFTNGKPLSGLLARP